MINRTHSTIGRVPAAQRGLTLIEFLVSIALGMVMVAALATLIADQSGNRAEVDRAGRLIENGRYAVRTMADDLQMAGYWGEVGSVAAFAGAGLPDPCLTTAVDLNSAMGLHVQGYDYPSGAAAAGYNATGAAPTFSCLSNIKPGTDIVAVRRAEPDTVAATTAGLLIQTGLDSATQNFSYVLKAGGSATDFPLVKKDLLTAANIRKVAVRIYYVSTCNVCSPSDGIPSLKMYEVVDNVTRTLVLAEGIENLQIDYGVDTDADGAPNSDAMAGSIAAGDWSAVSSAKIFMLVRNTENSPGYSDNTLGKSYLMGLAGTVAAAPATDHYKRHVFVQSVRFINPSARRSS
jgi:type IV pilus assembly protein PilW